LIKFLLSMPAPGSSMIALETFCAGSAILARQRVPTVVLDYAMPDMNRVEIAAEQ